MKETRADFTRRATERSLQEFQGTRIKKYTIDTCGDGRVCPVCEAQDGKEYAVADAVPGKNAPPFCDDCRCIIMAVFERESV